MSQTVRDIMSTDLTTVRPDDTVTDAARAMQQADVGTVVVTDDGTLQGLVTDRDLVVRAVAEGRDPSRTPVRDVCSGDLVTVGPDEEVQRVAATMRDRAVRRVPVVESGRPVGIVSIGDLAIERDSRSALADVSAARPNR